MSPYSLEYIDAIDFFMGHICKYSITMRICFQLIISKQEVRHWCEGGICFTTSKTAEIDSTFSIRIELIKIKNMWYIMNKEDETAIRLKTITYNNLIDTLKTELTEKPRKIMTISFAKTSDILWNWLKNKYVRFVIFNANRLNYGSSCQI